MALYAGDPDNYPASADLPEGGYQRNAGSVRIGDEAALDRTAYLNKARGRVQVVEIDSSSESNPAVTHDSIGGTNPDTVTGFTIAVAGCEVGECLEIRVQLALATNGANIEGRACIQVVEDTAGTPTTYQHNASKVWVDDALPYRTVQLQTIHEITDAGDARVEIEILGTAGNGGGASFDTATDRILVLEGISMQVWRHAHGVA